MKILMVNLMEFIEDGYPHVNLGGLFDAMSLVL